MKKVIVFLFIVLGLAGCVSAPPYPHTVNPALTNLPGVYHRVESGQTLWRISRMYDIELEDILQVNHNLESAKIEVGQMIFIPRRRDLSKPVLAYTNDDFIWPLKGRVITSFGANNRYLVNKGLNIQGPAGAPVVAARGGKVVFSAADFGNFGKILIIDHGDGLRSVYARNAEVYAKPGEIVKQGALIGRCGRTQRDKNEYLHFEIRKGALAQNPLYYLP